MDLKCVFKIAKGRWLSFILSVSGVVGNEACPQACHETPQVNGTEKRNVELSVFRLAFM